jgi:hypothetical protein
MEYQNVFLFVGIGSPASECVSPFRPKGERSNTSVLAGEGLGVPNSDDRKESLVLWVLYVVFTGHFVWGGEVIW